MAHSSKSFALLALALVLCFAGASHAQESAPTSGACHLSEIYSVPNDFWVQVLATPLIKGKLATQSYWHHVGSGDYRFAELTQDSRYKAKTSFLWLPCPAGTPTGTACGHIYVNGMYLGSQYTSTAVGTSLECRRWGTLFYFEKPRLHEGDSRIRYKQAIYMLENGQKRYVGVNDANTNHPTNVRLGLTERLVEWTAHKYTGICYWNK